MGIAEAKHALLRMRRARVLAAAALIVSACAVEAHPPQPPPRLMLATDAVAIATQFARSHGLVIDYTRTVRLDRYARWHVELGGAGGRDRAAVTVDGYSGAVLATRLSGAGGEIVPTVPGGPQPPPPTPPQPSASPPPPGAATPPPRPEG